MTDTNNSTITHTFPSESVNIRFWNESSIRETSDQSSIFAFFLSFNLMRDEACGQAQDKKRTSQNDCAHDKPYLFQCTVHTSSVGIYEVVVVAISW